MTLRLLTLAISISSFLVLRAVRLDPETARPYVEKTHQYLEDAKAALTATKKYKTLIEKIVENSEEGKAGSGPTLLSRTSEKLDAELERIHLKTWTAATNAVDRMLHNDKPAKAKAAAAKARVPFAKAVEKYRKSLSTYESAASEYAGRALNAKKLAHEVQGQGNQARLEGREMEAEQFGEQARYRTIVLVDEEEQASKKINSILVLVIFHYPVYFSYSSPRQGVLLVL